MKVGNQTKIFFNSFPEEFQEVKTNKETIIKGFVHKDSLIKNNKDISRNIITSILIHDKISLTRLDSLYLIDYFGIEDFLKLLDMHILEIVDDNDLFIGLVQKDNRFDVNIFNMANSDRFERILENTIGSQKNRKNKILYEIESNSIKINNIQVNEQILQEIDYDLNNLNYKNHYNINSNNRENILTLDVIKIIRTMHANKALIYSKNIDATNISVDMEANHILETKLNPSTKKQHINLSNSAFSEVLELKEIPDLIELYLKKIITFDDILKLRNSMSGKLFRIWYNSSDYNKEDILKALNVGSSNKSILQKTIRWIIPTALGIKYAAVAAGLSFADSFIIDSLIKGWKLNLFLDVKLKKSIDSCIAKYDKEDKARRIVHYFPDLDYWEKCPCKSGKVFGKCCGKKLWSTIY